MDGNGAVTTLKLVNSNPTSTGIVIATYVRSPESA